MLPQNGQAFNANVHRECAAIMTILTYLRNTIANDQPFGLLIDSVQGILFLLRCDAHGQEEEHYLMRKLLSFALAALLIVSAGLAMAQDAPLTRIEGKLRRSEIALKASYPDNAVIPGVSTTRTGVWARLM
jgi:hypothetical protein